MRKKRYTRSFERITIRNRWKMIFPPDDWVIIGIQQWYFSPVQYEIRLCFFGFDLRIWIKKTFVK